MSQGNILDAPERITQRKRAIHISNADNTNPHTRTPRFVFLPPLLCDPSLRFPHRATRVFLFFTLSSAHSFKYTTNANDWGSAPHQTHLPTYRPQRHLPRPNLPSRQAYMRGCRPPRAGHRRLGRETYGRGAAEQSAVAGARRKYWDRGLDGVQAIAAMTPGWALVPAGSLDSPFVSPGWTSAPLGLTVYT